MKPNGPAIKGVCVTRHPSGQCSYSLASMLSLWARGYGEVFAVQVQIAGGIRVSRYNLTKWFILKYVAVSLKRALEQCRDTNVSEARIESSYTSFIGSSCGYPGLTI